VVLFSGSRAAGGRRTEAEARAALARQLGIAGDAILTEATARTTREEALRIAPLLRARRASRVLLVADWDGMARATRLFEQAGFVVLPAPARVRGWSDSPGGRLQVMQLVLQERLAWLYYQAFGYL
jgi:uncharacterized SAM-binding protein YcdF (DUF218 family)